MRTTIISIDARLCLPWHKIDIILWRQSTDYLQAGTHQNLMCAYFRWMLFSCKISGKIRISMILISKKIIESSWKFVWNDVQSDMEIHIFFKFLTKKLIYSQGCQAEQFLIKGVSSLCDLRKIINVNQQ